MTTIIKNLDVRTIALGLAVTRATATIPQTATQNIFTVSGGRIAVVSLVGTVTTVIGGTATTLSVGLVPTTGTAAAASLATAVAITSKEVGTVVSLGATLGAALIVGGTSGNAGGGAAIDDGTKVLVPQGTISITTSASTTGAMSWDLVYVPLDAGAQVVAA